MGIRRYEVGEQNTSSMEASEGSGEKWSPVVLIVEHTEALPTRVQPRRVKFREDVVVVCDYFMASKGGYPVQRRLIIAFGRIGSHQTAAWQTGSEIALTQCDFWSFGVSFRSKSTSSITRGL